VKPLVLSFSTSRHGEPTTFGDFIRKARLEKGLKQVEVSEAIGVDENTIVNWEKATGLPTRYSKVKELCEFLPLDYPRLVETFSLISKSDAESFGADLRSARLKKGLTLERAARLAGLDPGTLARWEKSEHEPPRWMQYKLDAVHRVLAANAS
jgi:transcriptional regulator with XRE-family HTH domain